MYFDLVSLNGELESKSAQEIIEWSWETFSPKIALSSSFQSQSLALLHMVSQVVPEITILFLDTGYHFPETLEFRDRLQKELGLNVQVLEPVMGRDGFKRQFGALYLRNPDRCCYINKVEPLQRALKDYDAWISGIRRDQTADRAGTPIVSQKHESIYKICPLANWTKQQLHRYISEHGLPSHPLVEKGYLSIGCAPCTRAVSGGEDERAGRWAGSSKTECGLHTIPNYTGDATKGDRNLKTVEIKNEDLTH